ncbi:acyl-CoA thioesterase II [Vespertiliibacter pulmonis]|uniref:Acyl-CoA thioesterase 2 n=1 Tax=Vespertiliibacter pulmonis TaxID=1443036 RepID=A0A3N4WIN3_9PAST|nr:acyl-CoA thioesterase II [Vespertiliibacter pulmonis]QLB21379.1 acyl-CoA thioesterase II [Vespertiliibacter pulmonis]RPE85790.1 acyl-CoA thioesterase-2 [Vespertiliibacter pulmonis]
MTVITSLIDLLALEPLGNGIFRGRNEDLGLPQVFGGQIIAQALSAAMQMTDTERYLHSCHTYFLRAGDIAFPIIYETEILREGKNFTAININAKQNNELICRVMASFQVPERGFEHQITMPKTDKPDAFYSENTLIQSFATILPSPLREKFQKERAFDVRIKYPNDPFNGKKLPMEQFLWAKLNGAGQLDQLNQRLQQCLIAYFSDFHCIITMLQPHERGFMQQGLRVATLDHSIWFHRNIDFTQWLLFALQTPNASNGRGLTRGEVFDQQGNLLMSYQQEGLIRDSSIN